MISLEEKCPWLVDVIVELAACGFGNIGIAVHFHTIKEHGDFLPAHRDFSLLPFARFS